MKFAAVSPSRSGDPCAAVRSEPVGVGMIGRIAVGAQEGFKPSAVGVGIIIGRDAQKPVYGLVAAEHKRRDGGGSFGIIHESTPKGALAVERKVVKLNERIPKHSYAVRRRA